MNLPRITIVTTCLNDRKHIEDCLQSIHEQDYPDLKHIVIDGGSTDGSIEIIKEFEDRLAFWISEPDKGHGHALSKGLERATGDIVSWLCSNDMLLPGALRNTGEFFRDNPETPWAVGNGLLIDENNMILERVWAVPFTYLSMVCWQTWGTCQPAVFMRKDAIEKVGGINGDLRVSVDTDLFIKLAKISKPKKIDHFLAALRLHSDSQTCQYSDLVKKTDIEIRQREGGSGLPGVIDKFLYRYYHVRFRGYQTVCSLVKSKTPYSSGRKLKTGV